MAVAALRAALESERSSLQEIDASIKRIVQAPVPRHNHHDRFNNSSELGRPGAGRLSGGVRGSGEFPDTRPDELGKRRHETKTVFSRLSTRQDTESDHDDNGTFGKKPRMSSQVTRDLPSKQEIMKAQCGDEQSKTRNRRMFGSLLGTLQKFKQEEIVLKGKEEKKAEVERRIEQQAQQERENQRKERQTLFADRELKKVTIKALEAKLARVAEFDVWAASQQSLGNFILTRARPHIFWLPKRMDPRTEEKLASSRQHHEKYMDKKRKELDEELIKIEQKCLRSAKTSHTAIQSMDSKENKVADRQEGEDSDTEQTPRKREKFVSEVRVKDENGTVVKKEERESRKSNSNSKDLKERRHSERSQLQSREGESRPKSEGRESERTETKQDVEMQNGSPEPSVTQQDNSEEVEDKSALKTGDSTQTDSEPATCDTALPAPPPSDNTTNSSD